ncbi:YeeE/YedE family protein [Sneathiella limimaris]|uniref:YeeE/YedE family protein n=1 Tax=Sneathiella limimaris TaxID=1964213 RepID=UPI00146BE3C3|nr:YeeE/YedE family protein [Sneathiella limimaris]
MNKVIALVSGILFGYGLALSGMLSPSKVVGFLDLTGNWDPSLAFVMGGGLMVTVIAFHFLLKRPHPLFGDKFYLPTRKDIDKRLVIGSALFGLGWAIGGLCPGPALSSLAYASPKIAVFCVAMVVGIFIGKKVFPASAS